MRAAPLIALLLLPTLAGPALAQGKTKAPAVPQSVQALEVCERFASGDVLALEDATARGWDAWESDSESPYVRGYDATRTIPGIGEADLFVLIEDYPESTFGYCRIDVQAPRTEGSAGHEAIQAIQNLDRYEGTSQQVSAGTFASHTGTGENTESLLLTHWSDESFVIQLTIITPKVSN